MTNELSALFEVAGDAVDRLAVTPAESLHRAIARRVFRAVGPASAPIRVVHDAISGAAYWSVRRGLGGLFGAAALASRAGGEGRPLSRSQAGRSVVSALNAVIGDELEARGSGLAIPMSWRRRGPVRSRVAVFVHGLGGSDEQWPDIEVGPSRVYVRYNTGLPIADNGPRLAWLLEDLVTDWPVPVEELALVGHSMGGLVARSACQAGTAGGMAWPRLVRNLVTLGTPHSGAPLAKAVHSLAWALRKVPEAAPLGVILDTRSAGIKDLRLGLALPLPPECRHTFIYATVTRRAGHPLGWAAGDLLVRTASAKGPASAESRHLGALHHFDLLTHPVVYEELRRLL